MSRLKQNTTYRNGKRILCSWSVIANLSTGQERITLKGIKDRKLAVQIQNRVNDIEIQSKLYPSMKDWLKETYVACGREDLIPNYNDVIPTIKEGFDELIDTKSMHKEITKQKTIDAYRYACGVLVKVVGNIRINQISSVHKPKIELELHKRGYSDNTINIYVRNIMQFLRWCEEVQYLDKVPFKIKQIKTSKRSNAWIKQDDFNLITSKMDKVSRAYAVVSYHTGLRKCELNTNPSDKAYNGLYHSLSKKDNYLCISVNGKGGKVADIILPDHIKEQYDIMVMNRLHPTTISKKFKKACIDVGLPHYRFHDLRHSFCANQSLITQDAYLLKSKMRHSNLNTTQTYLNDERLDWVKQVESEQFKA